MDRPNLFEHATSELSQDAFVCWLARWADPAFRDADAALHATGAAFVRRLIAVGNGPPVGEIRSVTVERQWKNIDVLLWVNGNTAVVIEDKTDTGDHSDQLRRYREAVAAAYPHARIAAVYLKTGDQSDFQRASAAGYGQFLRRDFLDVLGEGERLGVKNAIFADFLAHLRRIEAAVQSFLTVPLKEWKDGYPWRGFFTVLQARLKDGNWGYVANPAGGFMGFWWHWRGDKYLQLEQNTTRAEDKLCFKVHVPAAVRRAAAWWEWHHALQAEAAARGVRIEKPVRRPGRWMTVAVLAEGYRVADSAGRLDLDRTVEKLEQAQALMDAALLRLPAVASPPASPDSPN